MAANNPQSSNEKTTDNKRSFDARNKKNCVPKSKTTRHYKASSSSEDSSSSKNFHWKQTHCLLKSRTFRTRYDHQSRSNTTAKSEKNSSREDKTTRKINSLKKHKQPRTGYISREYDEKLPYFVNETYEERGLGKKYNKIPYFADEARERERLRRKQGLQSQNEKNEGYYHHSSCRSYRRSSRSSFRTHSRSRSLSERRSPRHSIRNLEVPQFIRIPVPIPMSPRISALPYMAQRIYHGDIYHRFGMRPPPRMPFPSSSLSNMPPFILPPIRPHIQNWYRFSYG